MQRTLVLFDIDGTLVLTGRAGMRALDRAVAEVFGLSGLSGGVDSVPVAGRTDRAIITDLLAAIGRTYSEDALTQVRERYCALLPGEVLRPVPHPKLVLPGVRAALDHLDGLAATGAVSVGLLTGNFAHGARIKLEHFDLWRRFGFGAFGDDHVDRRDLVPVAIDAAARAGAGTFTPAETVIVGDTPADVDCAHAHGARAIAVATGGYNVAELGATGADVVVNDLTEWRLVWRALAGQPLRPNQ